MKKAEKKEKGGVQPTSKKVPRRGHRSDDGGV